MDNELKDIDLVDEKENEAPLAKTSKAIPGAGIDLPKHRRPGVPMEMKPHPMGNAHWTEPDRQKDPGNIQKRKGLAQLTPVFGTAVPPRGISGMMRRAAYNIPEHYTSHWLVLLLADRVDALEHRAARALPYALPLMAGAAVALAVTRSVQRRRRSFWSRLLA